MSLTPSMCAAFLNVMLWRVRWYLVYADVLCGYVFAAQPHYNYQNAKSGMWHVLSELITKAAAFNCCLSFLVSATFTQRMMFRTIRGKKYPPFFLFCCKLWRLWKKKKKKTCVMFFFFFSSGNCELLPLNNFICVEPFLPTVTHSLTTKGTDPHTHTSNQTADKR